MVRSFTPDSLIRSNFANDDFVGLKFVLSRGHRERTNTGERPLRNRNVEILGLSLGTGYDVCP